METDRHGTVGALAAHRPLLISVVFAFGLTALAVAGFSRAPGGVSVANFAINGLVALAMPALIAKFAPTTLSRRMVYVAAFAIALFAASRIAPQYSPDYLSAIAPTAASVQVGCMLMIWLILPRPIFGDVAGLSVAAPFAALLGAFGAGGLLALETLARSDVLGAIVSLSLALACMVGVGVAADFTHGFAKGARAGDAAGQSAYLATAPTVFAMLVTAGVFTAGLLPGAETLDWSWRAVLFSAGGVGLAVLTTLFITSATLSLSDATEEIAVVENHRRQNFRSWWRPFRQALPPSSAIAFVAILIILTIVALFTAYNTLTSIKIALLIACALAAGVTFVSLRTGIFVFAALFAGMVMIDWSYEIINVPAAGLLPELTAIACAAGLYGQIAVAWRDARSPRRKAREAAEQAMIVGAYRYLVSAGFALAAFLVAETSGLWMEGAEAALYLAALTVFGFFIAAPLMTAISAIFGRE